MLEARRPHRRCVPDWRRLWPGLTVVAVTSIAAWGLARLTGLEATLLALVLGVAVGAALRHPASLEPGAQVALKRALTAGVILLGVEVNVAFLAHAGPRAVLLAVILVPVTLALFWLLARVLRVEGDTWALLGAGTGICGLSAVIATGATLKSREQDITLAAASVGILSAVGLVVYPLIDIVVGMGAEVYGAWAGLSVHAIANAIAVGVAHGDDAARVAALTKLARVALLAPVLVVVALVVRRKARAKASRGALLPPMVWGFLAVALVASVVPLPADLVNGVRVVMHALLLVGIAGLGLVTRLAHLRDPRTLTLAVLGWFVLSALAWWGAWFAYG